jgi:hypothetical protein
LASNLGIGISFWRGGAEAQDDKKKAATNKTQTYPLYGFLYIFQISREERIKDKKNGDPQAEKDITEKSFCCHGLGPASLLGPRQFFKLNQSKTKE